MTRSARHMLDHSLHDEGRIRLGQTNLLGKVNYDVLPVEEELRRQRIAVVVVSLAKISPDHFTAQENQLLPFAYLGSHDPGDHTSEVFRECLGSLREVAARWQHDMSQKLLSSLNDVWITLQQWALRHAGALTVAAMIMDVVKASECHGRDRSQQTSMQSGRSCSDRALKTFDGKAEASRILPRVCRRSPSLWEDDPKIATTMRKIAIRKPRETTKLTKYRSFESLWKFARPEKDLDMFEDIVGDCYAFSWPA